VSSLAAHGATHAGNVRETNEDCLLVEPELGLYAVLDGMGGARAGDVASHRARDAIVEYVRARRGKMAPHALLEAAIQAGSAAVHGEARRRRDRRGMGTTVVACLQVDPYNVIIGHVGDSRAYLLRDGRMQQLTRDHTIVAELLASNAIRPEEAVHHPYKSVLSRNLGAKPETRVDLLDLALAPGDRLLLCSDGLTGFAATDAVAQLLGGADEPEHVSGDLVELALRGGGGDNISVVVMESGRAPVPRGTQILRDSGATAWWQRRPLFLQAAAERGLAQSPICAVLSAQEATEIVAGNLCEAVYHDLQQSTGVSVWTYAENLGNGWLDQGGPYPALRDLLDILRGAAGAVIADIAASGAPFATALEASVTRSLVVAEMAVGTVLADRLRAVEAELVRVHTSRAPTETGTFTEQVTIPYMKAVRVDPPGPEVAACLEQAQVRARADLATLEPRPGAADCIDSAHRIALEPTGDAGAAMAARELYGVRTLEEASVAPLLDAMDQARAVHLHVLRGLEVGAAVKAAALRRLAGAHQALYASVAGLVVEAGHPISDDLHRAVERTAALRNRAGDGEARLAELERSFVTQIDPPIGGARQP
jgi:PPM family protein phosphatase